jgi:hypothetical protein
MAPQLRLDISAAAARMSSRMGVNAEIRQLVDHLLPEETVALLAPAIHRSAASRGLLALTDRRLLFVKEKRIGMGVRDVQLPELTSAKWSGGFASGKLTVAAGGNQEEYSVVPNADGEAMTERLRAAISGVGRYAPEGAASGFGVTAPDVMREQPPAPIRDRPGDPAAFPMLVEQLRQLAELRDTGVISAADFETKKQELLARI